jgi:hypothetical protein
MRKGGAHDPCVIAEAMARSVEAEGVEAVARDMRGFAAQGRVLASVRLLLVKSEDEV